MIPLLFFGSTDFYVDVVISAFAGMTDKKNMVVP